MTATTQRAPSSDRGNTARGPLDVRAVELFVLALLSYVPFLLSSPGQVSADTKANLYLDPGRLLARAPYLWDSHVGAGTVPHQNIGYLFPMGPYFWLMDTVGVPDWIAQRLWLGTLSLVAVLGARWLLSMLGCGRVGALAGAVVYMLTPYQLAFTGRASVLLLPWAGLPLLVGLTMRAVRRGGWRDPVLFALVALTIGGTNATSLVLLGLAPLIWLVFAALGSRPARRAALRAAGRIAIPTIGVSLWWVIALRVQGAYGLPVLQLTETSRTVSGSSLPTDLLRGLGNWVFYGGDRLGFSLDQAADYSGDRLVIVATFAIPILALAVAGILRWRYRAYFAALIVVGTIVGVGAWPYEDPSLIGRLFKAFATGSSAGLALRNTPRVVPIIVLGFAGLLGAAITALATHRRMLVAAGTVIALTLLAFLPVWRLGYFSEPNLAPEDVPTYWKDAAAQLDHQARSGDGGGTRAWEIPGSMFAAYRWGTTVDPVTPGISDRPWMAREVLPAGTPPSVGLLAALDHRVQEGTLEVAALAPVARLLNVGTVVLRSDLAFERFDTPRPRTLWEMLTRPRPSGLAPPRAFGPRRPNLASAAVPMLDEQELATRSDSEPPPPVALFPVTDSASIVHTAPGRQPVVLAGDAEGIVDAASAGLIDGNQLVLYLASLDRAELRGALRGGADLVVTDTNRRRAQTWFASIRDTTGATERAGQKAPADDRDFRLDTVPSAGDASRTVAEQRGGTADATSYGDRDRYTPEDRPANAVDGDLATAWRVAGAGALDGDRLVLEPARPQRIDRITLVQPQGGVRDRVLTSARVHLDDGRSIDVVLGPESLTPEGQVVRFSPRTVRSVEIEPLTTNVDDVAEPVGANPVGFAEVQIGDARVTETVRLPLDLARRVGADANGHRLDVVLTRLRVDPAQRDRLDEERVLVRRVVLPDARSFGVAGTARVDPNAPDALLDSVLGTTASGATFSASSHLRGDLAARASAAFDGDPATAWQAGFGPQVGQWIEADVPTPTTFDHADLEIVADGRHSDPTQVRVEVDGIVGPSIAVPAVADGPVGTVRRAPVVFAPVTGTRIRLVVEAVRSVMTVDDRTRAAVELPMAIAEVGIEGVPTAVTPVAIPSNCRLDLLQVDGVPVAAQVSGPVADARTGLALSGCGEPLALGAGSHTVKGTLPSATGIDVDRVVLSSDREGAPTEVAPLGAPLDSSGARVRVIDERPTSYDLRVTTDGRPFWLVLGQSHSDGWHAETGSGHDLGAPRLVNGYANGWLIDPGRAGTVDVHLDWRPQHLVWWGLGISVLAVLGCLGVLIATRRRTRRVELADRPELTSPLGYAPPTVPTGIALGVGAVVGVAEGIVSRPWIGVVVGVLTVLAARTSWARVALTAGSPLALVVAKLAGLPELGWLAVTLLAADLACSYLRSHWLRLSPGYAGVRDAGPPHNDFAGIRRIVPAAASSWHVS